MPTYEFRNKDTQEIHQEIMSYSDKEKYLIENPEYESVFTSAPSLGDGVRMGFIKPDSGFQEVISKIVERTPGASGLNKHLSRSSKRSL
jgi:hypothetical protein